jgi:CheY-like chemotaxis protein
LVRYGIEKSQISVLQSADELDGAGLTHLVCFKKMLNDALVEKAKANNIALFVMHEDFLFIEEESTEFNVSRYGYYGDRLYEFLSHQHMPRVLIVDDDAINLELIKAILSDEFCRIDTALNGEDAMDMLTDALAEGYPYTIAFLDRHMSGISGMEMLRQYKEVEKQYRYKPLYAVSISGDVREEHDTLFDDYIGKPFTKTLVKEAFAKALRH